MRRRRARIVTPIMNAELKIATLIAKAPASNWVWLTSSSASERAEHEHRTGDGLS